MMRIPGPGNLGNVTAKPSPGFATPIGAYGGDVAAATVNLGNTAQNVVGAEMTDELRAAQQQQREDQIRRQKADSSMAARRLQSSGEDLHAAYDEVAAGVLDGSIDKTKAEKEWQARKAKIQSAALKDVPPDYADHVASGLVIEGKKLDRGFVKVMRERERTDTKGNLSALLEGWERDALTDPATATKRADSAIDELGPIAGLNAEQIQKTKQGFRERVANTTAVQKVTNDPAGALKFLKDTSNLPDLDPDRRLSLIATADAAVLRQQERARIAQERVAREQERTFQGASAVFESGRAFSADYAANLQKQLKGSPYEGALREMISAGPQNVATATQPIPVQRAQLQALYAQANAAGSNPATNKEIERRQKVLQESEKDVKADPLMAANERGIVQQLTPLDVSNLQTLPQQLTDRVSAARTTSVWAGQPVSPLTQPEAENLAATLGKLPPEQKATALAMLGTTVGDKGMIVALAKQVDKQDQTLATAMLYSDTKTSQGRYVSEILLRGQQGIKDGKVKATDMDKINTRSTIATEIGDAYPNEELRQRAIDAAYLVQAGLLSEGKGDVERAIRLATGGIQTQADGSKVPRPYGWTEDEFDKRRATMTKDDIGGAGEVYADGQAVSTEKFLAQLPAASLIAVGGGRYAVRAGSGFVTDRAGKRVVLDFK